MDGCVASELIDAGLAEPRAFVDSAGDVLSAREAARSLLAGNLHASPDPTLAVLLLTATLLHGVGTQNGPRYTLRFCRAFDGAHLAKRSERGGWRIGIGPEVIAGEIDMLPTER